ncbi:MAG: hypothetical protein CMJ58_02565 [Planctomycetaceae bacterium]|nr:hypothetical protein [Planctomycetaceae bacterium]
MTLTNRRGVSETAGFTLVELLVVIAIIGTLVGMLLPAVQAAREASRGNHCRANLTQLHRAMAQYELSNEELPGYVEPVPMLVGQASASWSTMLLPFLERSDLWEEFSQGGSFAAPLELFLCPSNPPDTEGAPAMSYLANAGYIGNERPHDPGDCAPVENIANGVFFDRTRDGGTSFSDIRDLKPDCKEPGADAVFKMTMGYIQSKGDGSTGTLMFSEGLSALYWTWVGGQSPNKKWDFGFCWEQPGAIAQSARDGQTDVFNASRYMAINGVRENIGGASLKSKTRNSAIASSNHPGGVNVAFVAGNVRYLSEKISPVVFAQLMTSNRKASELVVGGVRDRDLPPPSDDAF